MFDYYNVGVGPSSMTVTEQRAPTDESVKLLREMEAAALQGILKTVDVKNNVVEGKVVFMRHSPLQDVKLIAVFKLNGKQFTCKSTCSEIDFLVKSERLAGEALVEGLTYAIMGELKNTLEEIK
jgi:hypothetical protein